MGDHGTVCRVLAQGDQQGNGVGGEQTAHTWRGEYAAGGGAGEGSGERMVEGGEGGGEWWRMVENGGDRGFEKEGGGGGGHNVGGDAYLRNRACRV
jgi:hypothetical protein